MKKTLAVVSTLAAASLFAAVAPDADTITFSTTGVDTYADGVTQVEDGECYALVWSQDGVFEGIKADGTPVDANDKVAFIGGFAKGGKCPTVVFTIPAGYVTGGQFEVYILDTRRYAADGSVSVGKQGGKIAVNAASKVATAVVAKSGDITGGETVVESAVSASAATALPADVPQPKITDIDASGDYVVLTVENTVGYVNYAAEQAATVGGDKKTVGDAQIGGGTIYLVSPKNATGSGFIKVIRK